GVVGAFAMVWRIMRSILNVLARSVQSEAQMRRMMELSGDWYWQQDTDQVLTRIVYRGMEFPKDPDRAPLPFVGYRRQEVEGLRLLEKSPNWSEFSALLNEHKQFDRLKFEYWPADRLRLIYESTGRPVFKRDEGFIGYEGVSADITQKWLNEKLLSIQRYFLQGVLLSAPLTELTSSYARGLKQCLSVHCELVMGFRENIEQESWQIRGAGPDFRITKEFGDSVWARADEILMSIEGYENKGLIQVGLLPEELIPQDWREEHNIRSVWVEIKQADGPNQPEYWVLVAQKHPEGPQTDDVMRVMTGLRLLGLCVERRVFEDELLRLNHNLEERIASRTSELTEINTELKAFTYTVSHDLRAPLRAIDGFSSILREETGDSLSEDAKGLLDRICSNAQQMGALIDGLLEFSRQLRTEINRTEVNMAELVEGILNQLDARAKAEVQVAELPKVDADPVLIQQVWQNLIDNALKFSGKKKSPKIAIDCQPIKRGWKFTVADNGQGFDMRYAEKLFKVFERLHHKREFEGTGVGLAIVKRIIERHHGSIWAESTLGEGAKFCFTILSEPESEPVQNVVANRH
ncbi:MAG: ATP-binding protein, partial [Limnobacter sp.]|nr:ATP-binding protein [Limnobacter sp.]